jgi:tripartite-type tricarboxylate transporter receptor subunit TctC
MKNRFPVLVASLGVLLFWPAVVFAQTAGGFYKGKTLTLIVSDAAGGGYDIMARTVAKYLPSHLPGSPRIIVQNMPGAGGIVAMNYLYTTAPKDGTMIAAVDNNTPVEPLLGTPEAKYEATRFNWLGSPTIETGLVIVWHTAPVNSVDDLRKHEISVGSSGANSTPSFYARLINATLGTRMRIVVGYTGQTDVYLAMERGEVDGFPSMFFNTLNATRPNWRTEKKVKVLLQFGLEREPSLPNVPSALDLASKPEDKLLLKAGLAEVALGRPYLMPPNVPPDRVAVMRKAMFETFTDPGFLAETNRMNLGVHSPRTGEQLQQTIEEAYRTPPEIVRRLRQLSLH